MCQIISFSLAIGNKGQNAKLAAKLTGYKIDIKPQVNTATGETAPELSEDFVVPAAEKPVEDESATEEINISSEENAEVSADKAEE